MGLILRTAARSDVGVVRTRNEDSGYAAPRLIAVADGMGGHAAGELASATAVATLAEVDSLTLHADDIVRVATEVVDIASDRIAEATSDDENRSGMGTTLTSVLLLERAVAVLHVGDSRAYLWRDSRLTQMTKDHTYVQALLDAGQISPDEAQVHPRRNLILRAIDGTPGVMVDVSLREARPGDRYLVCSDGLSSVVAVESIGASLAIEDATACVTDLVEKALAAGAPDNVTVIVADVIDVDDGDPHQDTEPVVVGAAAEPRNRVELPDVVFPQDVQPDPEGVLSLRERLTGTDFSILGSVYREQRLGRAGRVPSPETTRRVAWLLIASGLAVILVALVVGWAWARGQWFVASDDDGVVVIGNGINAEVLGIRLARTVEQTTLRADSLPEYDRDLLRDAIHAADLTEAREVVTRLACRAVPPVAPCPGYGSAP